MKNIKEREDIPRMYLEEKLSTVQIGEKVGLAVGAVGSILRIRGITLRNPKEGWKTRFPDGRFGKLAANWKGGKRKTGLGYIQVLCSDHPYSTKQGYVMEHRLVMEEHLGRYLEPEEMVHHLNGKRGDNRLENLEASTRSEHVKKHFGAVKEVDRLEKENKELREILRKYAEDHISWYHSEVAWNPG